MDTNDLLRAARTGLKNGDFSLWDIWISFMSHGGDADPFDIEAFIQAVHTLSTSDVLVLDLTLEELLTR